MKGKFAALALFLSACSSGPPPRTLADVSRDRYLADPQTSEEMKAAIRSGVVIVGMCPLQAFAAAGLPGPYKVKVDQSVWGPGPVFPPKVVTAQCDNPDGSEIELKFRNATQFDGDAPVVFNVKFVRGKVVEITRQQ